MDVTQTNHGTGYTGAAPLLTPRGGFARVEAIAEGALVVDGVLLDLRGATAAATVTHHKEDDHFGGISPYADVNRDSEGTYTANVVTTTATAASTTGTTSVLTYPHALVGTGGQTVTETQAGSIPVPSAIDRMKAAFKALHLTGRVLEDAIEQFRPGHPAASAAKAHDFLFYSRQYSYLLAHSRDYTLDQKVAWCKAMPQGSLNISTAQGITAAAKAFFDRADTISAPTSPSAWRDPSDGSARALDNMVTLTGTVPMGTDLTFGTWIDALDVHPIAVSAFGGLNTTVGASDLVVDVSAHFWDHDPLTYTATSSDTAIVTVTVSGPNVTISQVAAGSANVTVRATDTSSQHVELSFSVVVTAD